MLMLECNKNDADYDDDSESESGCEWRNFYYKHLHAILHSVIFLLFSLHSNDCLSVRPFVCFFVLQRKESYFLIICNLIHSDLTVPSRSQKIVFVPLWLFKKNHTMASCSFLSFSIFPLCTVGVQRKINNSLIVSFKMTFFFKLIRKFSLYKEIKSEFYVNNVQV